MLGMSFYGARRFREAITYLHPLVDADPDNTELRQVLAQSCLSAKNYACAEEQFRKIVERNPDSASAHILTGEALDGLKRTDEAIAEFQKAVQLSPQEPDVHFGLGYLYWKLQQYAQAKIEFETELTISPTHAQALAYLGDIELKRGHLDAASDSLKNQLSRARFCESHTWTWVKSEAGKSLMRQLRMPTAGRLNWIRASPTQPTVWDELIRQWGKLPQPRSNSRKRASCTSRTMIQPSCNSRPHQFRLRIEMLFRCEPKLSCKPYLWGSTTLST